jgi:hypothetical protein
MKARRPPRITRQCQQVANREQEVYFIFLRLERAESYLRGNVMIKRIIHYAFLLTAALCLSASLAQAQTASGNDQRSDQSISAAGGLRLSGLLAQSPTKRRPAFSLMPKERQLSASTPAFTFTPMAVGPDLPVMGSGTVGRLTRWTYLITKKNWFIGDSIIFEDSSGRIGIGTDSPTSRLTVVGMIHSTAGGFRFPDGSIQSTAGVAPGQVVRSLNGLMGDLSLVAGPNIIIKPGGSSVGIAATGLLSAVNHDATLTGNGTVGSLLGLSVPLVLSGSNSGSIISVINAEGYGLYAESGGITYAAVRAKGGEDHLNIPPFSRGGDGVFTEGGFSENGYGGPGIRAFGGNSNSGEGGIGVYSRGGFSHSAVGGVGVIAEGGWIISSGDGGDGVQAAGGDSNNGNGGNGVVAYGQYGTGAGNKGGDGIVAYPGNGNKGAAHGLAGKFNGDVDVTGTLSAATKMFRIDHPLDPENKYLNHTSVESPDMMNIYNGNVVTDGNGEAVVELPAYFEALNRDFRYQLTVIGTFAQAIVADEIKNNRFVIRTSAPGVKVSWQVTGIRQDAFANKNRIPVEVEKPERERGFYLHPEVFNQPEEKGVDWARNPERMQQLKQQRVEAEKKRTQQR